MEKDFEAWHGLKRQIHEDPMGTLMGYKEREVWWLRLGCNVGFEEDGKGENFSRPVLIVKGFSHRLFWGVPLSTTGKRGRYYYPFIVNGTVSVALISQLRAFDTKRLMNKVGTMSQKDFAVLKHKLLDFLS